MAIFGKDKNSNDEVLDKVPTSFTNTSAPVVPKINKDSKAKSNSTTLIARDTQIVGDIKFSGNLEVEGNIQGNITANANEEASIRILEDGHIQGDIYVPKAIINGTVKGNVHAASLELAAKARIDGNVNYQTLEMTKGAQVNGSLVYAEKIEQQAPAKKAEAINPNQGK